MTVTSDPSAEARPATNPVAEQLLADIADAYESLSRQLKQIARYVEQHRDHIGLDRIQDVAQRCEVQPSAVIRFAKRFGFSGYSEMQKIFRDGIAQQIAPSRNYQVRIRRVIAQAQGRLSSADIADEFIGGSIAGMQEFKRDLHSSAFDDAVALLADTPSIWVVGCGRSFAVATYLTYAMQLRGVRAGDVMVVISFTPYAPESLECARVAVSRGARLIAITDSQMSPLAAMSAATLVVHESSTFGFRSLTNTMCLAQSLFIALAYRTELPSVPVDAATAAER